MYGGIKLDVRVRDYAGARAALETRSQGMRCGADVLDPAVRKEAPLGHRRSKVTGVRLLGDGSIAFRLYATDVVTWHPDNSVSVVSYPTQTTSAFADVLLPAGLRLGGANEMMTFFRGCGQPADWQEWWAAAHVCNGTGTYRQVEGTWLPDDDTLHPINVVELDKAIAGQVCREINFAAFKRWLFAACDLIDIEHEGVDRAACGEAMRVGDWRTAARYLPTVSRSHAFGNYARIKPLRMRGVWHGAPVTLGSVERMRRWLYEEAGAYTVRRVTTIPAEEFARKNRLRNSLERSGVYV